ncbi:MAG: hypothetical protein ACYCWE_21280 [Eubacteriales bacterium]
MTVTEKVKLIAEKAASEKARKNKVKTEKVKAFDKMTANEKIAYIAAVLGITEVL